MTARQSIASFPEDQDRRDFGNYLSGLTDGEGCFALHWFRKRDHGFATFAIEMRADEQRILELIQQFLGCGRFTISKPSKRLPNGKPRLKLFVSRPRDLAKIIVPHFEEFPLRAKKARDFQIWKEGVALLREITRRRLKALGGGRGFLPRWTDRDKEEFRRLVVALKEQRRFETSGLPLPAPTPVTPDTKPRESTGLLFDV